MNKENCALKLVDEIILYYDARSKKHRMLIYIAGIFTFIRYFENTSIYTHRHIHIYIGIHIYT